MRTSLDALRSLKKYMALALGNTWEVRLSMDEGTFSRPQALLTAAGSPVNSQGTSHTVDVQAPFVAYLYPVAGASADESLFNAAAAEELLYAAFHVGSGAFGKPLRIPLYDYANKDVDDAANDSTRQLVSLTGSPTGGTFRLTLGTETTAAIAYNASPAVVAERLANLNSLTAADVTVTSAANQWTVTFSPYKGSVAAMTTIPALTGGTSPSASVSVLYQPNRGANNSGSGTVSPHGDYLRIQPAPTIQRVQDPEDETLYTVVCEIRLSWRRSGALLSGESVQNISIQLGLEEIS